MSHTEDIKKTIRKIETAQVQQDTIIPIPNYQKQPKYSFANIFGQQSPKDLLRENIILPYLFPELFQGNRRPFWNILLYGHPNVGKSTIIEAMANEIHSNLFVFEGFDVKIEQKQKYIYKLFWDARNAKGSSVIIIKNLENLLNGEDDESRRAKTELLVQMQGVGSKDNEILVIGTSSQPWEIDPAFRRKFSKRIYVDLPNWDARREIFVKELFRYRNDIKIAQLDELRDPTEGMTCGDVVNICRDVASKVVKEAVKCGFARRNGLYYPEQQGNQQPLASIKNRSFVQTSKVTLEMVKDAVCMYKRVKLDEEKMNEFTKVFGQ